MIAAVEELGPYIVITPHIAIAHARPSEEVLQDGISVINLAAAVEFGNKDNDPVDVVFSLAATSNDTHLMVLANLADILSDENKVQILRTSTNLNQVYRILNN